MSLSKSQCWYSNNRLHFLECAIPLKTLNFSMILLRYSLNAGSPTSIKQGHQHFITFEINVEMVKKIYFIQTR
jgi:hypothetical protein